MYSYCIKLKLLHHIKHIPLQQSRDSIMQGKELIILKKPSDAHYCFLWQKLFYNEHHWSLTLKWSELLLEMDDSWSPIITIFNRDLWETLSLYLFGLYLKLFFMREDRDGVDEGLLQGSCSSVPGILLLNFNRYHRYQISRPTKTHFCGVDGTFLAKL